MARILLVSDTSTVLDGLRAVVDDGTNVVREVYDGRSVRAAAVADPPDLVIADSQVQSMGGFAVCMDLKLEESGGRLPPIPVLVLLDRRADVFLARRAAAEGFLVKPLDPLRLRKAVASLLEGGTFEDDSLRPLSASAG